MNPSPFRRSTGLEVTPVDAVLRHQLLQPALGQELAIDEIEPDRLARLMELLEQAGHLAFFSISSTGHLADHLVQREAVLLLQLGDCGAEAPKVDMVIVACRRWPT